MLPTSPWVPIVQLCVELRIPYTAVYRDVLASKIPAERHGHRWFVRRETLEAMRAQQAPVVVDRLPAVA